MFHYSASESPAEEYFCPPHQEWVLTAINGAPGFLESPTSFYSD